MEKVRRFLAWLGAFALAAGSFLVFVVILRRKTEVSSRTGEVEAKTKAVDAKATAALAQVDAEAESKRDEVEVQHAEAVRNMEHDNAKRAAALRDSRAALAKALQRHARKPPDSGDS